MFMVMVSTIIYIHTPLNRFILPQPLRPNTWPPSKIFKRSKQRICFAGKKGTGAAETMFYQSRIGRARMETRPSTEHTRCACMVTKSWGAPGEKKGQAKKVR